LAVDDAEFREFFASEYSLLCWAAVEARSLGRARPAEVVPPADSERAMVLWEAVRSLPPRQRAVLVLRYQEDLTEVEVARLLGLPVGTVKSASHRALGRLRERLGTYDLDPAGSNTEERR
jgi:DNA-directed RNA polymerase specialized sigma24 family protein